MSYKRSHPLAAERERPFHLSDSSGNAITGATFATTDLQRRKPGASTYTNCDATQQSAVVEIGGGDYVYTYTVGELDTIGTGQAFKVNKSGAVTVTYVDEVQPAYFTTVSSSPATTGFISDRTEAVDGYWVDSLVVALTGALIGQVKKIGSYVGASKTLGLAATLAWTAAPSPGDVFEILVR